MIIKLFPPSDEDIAVHQLPEPDMVVDPRPTAMFRYKFELSVNGTALTIRRIERGQDEGPGWLQHVLFRVYNSNEFHYSFEKTRYLYHGVYGEDAPKNSTEIIIEDGVKTIRRLAFYECSSLLKIHIPKTVTTIQNNAFYGCRSLRCIQLPPNLQYIGRGAFGACSSLETIYVPSTVTEICDNAFGLCKSLKIINIPSSAQTIEDNIIRGCDGILTYEIKNAPSYKKTQLIRHRYSPLHNLCWDPYVTPNSIQRYIQEYDNNEERSTTNDRPRFTPLHLLAANPAVTGKMITAYLQHAPDVAIMTDNSGKTPLHMLCSVPNFSDASGGAIRAYIEQGVEGKLAAFMKDDKEMTPFDYLCKEKCYNEMFFLKSKSFGDLMEWWHDCLGVNLFAGTFEITR